MEYKKVKPCKELEPYIHFYWELRGNETESQLERVYPDGCAGVFVNLGDTCLTDNGTVSTEFGKTYVVGAMTSFKDSIIESNTRLVGACLKPAAFANFYNCSSDDFLLNDTIEFEKSDSFDVDSTLNDPYNYLNYFFSNRIIIKNHRLQSVIHDMHVSKGQLSVYEVSKRNFTTIRQLERNFKKYIGLAPKAYLNIIRFQHAWNKIKNSGENSHFLDIAFECGYYDLSHFSNEIKRITGVSPSKL